MCSEEWQDMNMNPWLLAHVNLLCIQHTQFNCQGLCQHNVLFACLSTMTVRYLEWLYLSLNIPIVLDFFEVQMNLYSYSEFFILIIFFWQKNWFPFFLLLIVYFTFQLKIWIFHVKNYNKIAFWNVNTVKFWKCFIGINF